jgi:hypothetical protein
MLLCRGPILILVVLLKATATITAALATPVPAASIATTIPTTAIAATLPTATIAAALTTTTLLWSRPLQNALLSCKMPLAIGRTPADPWGILLALGGDDYRF